MGSSRGTGDYSLYFGFVPVFSLLLIMIIFIGLMLRLDLMLIGWLI